MVKISTNDLRSGKVVRLDDKQAYMVVEASHYKPGKGQALVRARLKNLKTGQVFEKNLKADEPIESAFFESKEGEYLYRAGDSFVFMDHENFEQHTLPEDVVGESHDLLKENTPIYFTVLDGEIIGIEFPNFLELKIVETPPGVRGDTVSGATKPAKLETGAEVNVPLFIKEGDIIQVDTRTREYVKRV